MKLLVAASPLELQAFDENIDGFDRVTTGIGKVHAAVGLTQALERGTYDEIVVVGTSGAVDPVVEGRVRDISRVIQHDVHNDGVIGEHVSMPAFIDLGREGLTIATGDSFIDDAVVAAKVRELGATMLDMESFVYAWVAQHYGVPIRIARIASDSAQDGATKLWDEVVAECSVELWNWFRGEYLS